jgi:hypothetical protein
MTISTKTFQNLQPGVSAADDLRVRTPINQALQWLGEGLPNEINAEFASISASLSNINSALAQISQSVSAHIVTALTGKAGLQTYTEGTFTAGISFGGGTTGITYAAQGGTYTRIGRVVQVDINIVLTSKGSSTGDVLITGLPLTVAATRPLSVAINNMTSGVGDTVVQCEAVGGGTTANLRDIAAGVTAAMTEADFTDTSVIRVQGVYRTSA